MELKDGDYICDNCHNIIKINDITKKTIANIEENERFEIGYGHSGIDDLNYN